MLASSSGELNAFVRFSWDMVEKEFPFAKNQDTRQDREIVKEVDHCVGYRSTHYSYTI